MSSQRSADVVEMQPPRLLHLPPDVASSAALEAIEFAENALGISLDPWQRWIVEYALAERRDGSWSAFEVAIICPRQNGKNYVLEVIQLASVYLFGDRTLVHSAHKFDTSVEHFNRLKWLMENTPELSGLLLPSDRSFVTSNGKEHIRLNTGQRVLFKARYRGGGRGFTGDKVFLDEAYDLPAQAIGALIPTLSTRPGAQVYYTSSAPHETSNVLHAVRNRAIHPEPGDRLFLAEWGTDADDADEVLYGDREALLDAIRSANPAVAAGRISEEYILQEIRTFSGDPELVEEHKRERLGIATPPVTADAGPIPPERWEQLTDGRSKPNNDAAVRLALEVSPDRRWATFGLAGERSDALIHVEVRDALDLRSVPAKRVVERAAELSSGHGTPVVIVKGSPAESFAADLLARGVEVDVMSTPEFAAACGRLIDAAAGVSPTIRHHGQPQVRVALTAARLKDSGDGAQVWSRRGSSTDISPLTAITAAFGRIPQPAEAEPEFFVY